MHRRNMDSADPTGPEFMLKQAFSGNGLPPLVVDNKAIGTPGSTMVNILPDIR